MRVHPIIFLAAAVSLPAQTAIPTDPLEALVRDSPFLPGAGPARTTATGEKGPLELRSVVFERGQYFFSVYDQGSRESTWVTLGQPDLPFVARSYDQEQEILTVEQQGRTIALKLQPAHIVGQSQPEATPAPPALPSAEEAARQGGARPANSAPPNPSPAAPPAAIKPEDQRLQEMADEIRRRRQQPVQPPSN